MCKAEGGVPQHVPPSLRGDLATDVVGHVVHDDSAQACLGPIVFGRVGRAWHDRQVRVLAEVLADDRVCAQADLVGAPRAVHVAEDELDLGPWPQELVSAWIKSSASVNATASPWAERCTCG